MRWSKTDLDVVQCKSDEIDFDEEFMMLCSMYNDSNTRFSRKTRSVSPAKRNGIGLAAVEGSAFMPAPMRLTRKKQGKSDITNGSGNVVGTQPILDCGIKSHTACSLFPPAFTLSDPDDSKQVLSGEFDLNERTKSAA